MRNILIITISLFILSTSGFAYKYESNRYLWKKRTWSASFLPLGLPQFQNNQRTKGYSLMIAQGLGITGTFVGGFAKKGTHHFGKVELISFLFFLLSYGYSVCDGLYFYQDYNQKIFRDIDQQDYYQISMNFRF